MENKIKTFTLRQARNFFLLTMPVSSIFFISSCNSDHKGKDQGTYFAFTPKEMDIILTNYSSAVKPIGEPQVTETSILADSAKGVIIHEVLTTRNFEFTVPLDDKGVLIEDPKDAVARKKNDCPGTGTITCRLRCSGTGCTWSGCNSYPCSGGSCAGGCTLLDCKQIASGTGKKFTVMQ